MAVLSALLGPIRTEDEPDFTINETFRLSNAETRRIYEKAYQATRALYYRETPPFDEILAAVAAAAPDL